MVPDEDSIGEILRFCRRRARLTQRQLADRAGVGLRTVGEIESGRVRSPRPDSVRRLAAALALPGAEQLHLLSLAGVDDEHDSLRLSISVLGTLLVRRGAHPVDVVSPKLRAVLALLAVNAGQVVPCAEIVDALWDDEPPVSCRRLVRLYARRLQRQLQPGRRVPSDPVLADVPGGYRLNVPEDHLDVTRFANLARRASRALSGGHRASALELFERALSVWRGPVLADVDGPVRRHPKLVALSDQRLAAALSYADLGFDLGWYGRIARRLRELLPHEPLNEALHARLMLALAGAGQQAVALGLFAALRNRLAEELGVTPGPALRAAHLRVLRQELPVRPGRA